MVYCVIIAIVLIGCFFWFTAKNKYGPDVSQSYQSAEGEFTIKGRKGKFVIRKNDSVEFLVEDGKITAVKDLKKSNKYVYYEEGTSNGSD